MPRAALTLAGGSLLGGLGLLAGRGSLGLLRLPAAAVAVAAVAAAALSVAPALSIVGGYSRYESLPVRLGYLGLFCGAAWLGARERTVTGFLAGCGIVALEAVYEAATGALPRPDGNLGQANLLGAVLAMALPLSVGRAVADRRWLLLTGLLAAGLAVSTSRSGWLGALAGLGVLAVFLVPRRRLPLVLGLAAAALALAAAGVVASPLRNLNADTGAARVGVWRDSLAVIAERPLLGFGEDATGLVFGRHQSADWEPGHNFDRAHSMPLDLAITQGLAGLAACTWLFAAWWRGVWRRRQLAGAAGAVAAYLAWSLVNFDWAPATAVLWLLAGAAWPAADVGATLASPSGQSAPNRGRGTPRPYIAGALAALGLALAVPPIVADVELYFGRPALAAAIDPPQPRYHAARGGLAGLREAARLGDPDPATYVALGDAEAAAGDRLAAQAAYRRALSIYPYDVEARRKLASASRTAASG